MALTRITKGVIKPNENYDTHNINSTGIVTAVGANFSGNVSVGGVLTYEDVTNIDSVGIITARQGIFIDDSITHIGDTNTKIRFPAADTITAETGGSERVRISSGGSIGIGTDNPQQDVHILRSQLSRVRIESTSTAYNSDVIFQNPDGLLGVVGYNAVLDTINIDSRGGTGGVTFTRTGSEQVRIKSDGKVGIGTSNPTEQLEIYNGASSGNSTFRMRSLDGSTHLSLDARGTNASNMIYFTDSSAVYNSFINRSHSSNANFAGLKYAYNGSAHVAFRISESGGFEFGDSGNQGANNGNYGTSTSTYNSNTGKSKQALVTNGNAPPNWAYTNRPAFFARQNAGTSQTIGHGSWTKVNVDEEVLDTDGAFSGSRFTVPTGGAGWYQCFFSCGIDDIQAGDYVYSRLYLNGSGITHGIAMDWAASANAIIQANGSHMVFMEDGDYLELYVYHQEGTTEATEQSRMYFGAFRLNI